VPPEDPVNKTPDRSLELVRPLAVLDVQSTGLDTENARIVKLSVLKVDTGGGEHSKSVIVNPGIPIPPGATQVHGITDLDVMDKPVFRAYARALADHLEGCDLAGFGIERFGLPLLLAEFERNGVDFVVEGRAVIDAMTVFHRLEPRNLRSAYARFVTGQPPESSEVPGSGPEKDSETADEAQGARNIYAIILGELRSSSQVPIKPGEIAAWAKGIGESAIDPDGKFVWSEEGDALVNFGRHRGVRLVEVASSDPNYLYWISSSSEFGPEVRKIAESASNGYLPERQRSSDLGSESSATPGSNDESAPASDDHSIYKRPQASEPESQPEPEP
jgi:DNA polymerase-3 subunit epsilon